ncbi:MAG: PhnD/SsuA/transferrin family substrate-binding protein, partial [Dehalococcoidia bacterium]|nr:PhnD/SsuA/transferrin family substrate-binding protein [Dehalococcoidia bacterium]
VYDFIVKRDPALAARTKIIWKSPPYGINPVVVNPNLSPELRRQFESIFLGMSSDTQGMEILKNLGIDTFTKPDAAAYDAIEEMIRVTGFK